MWEGAVALGEWLEIRHQVGNLGAVLESNVEMQARTQIVGCGPGVLNLFDQYKVGGARQYGQLSVRSSNSLSRDFWLSGLFSLSGNLWLC